MKKIKVGILGGAASFHHLAADRVFKSDQTEMVHCESFQQLFENADSGVVDYSIAAIENSNAGSIFSNYDLWRKFDLHAIAEIAIKIEHHLMVLPGQTIRDIQEIHSHPMAIRQCEKFIGQLRSKNIKIVERSSTIESVLHVRQNNLPGVAAIASREAAGIYGLKIIKKNIETKIKNITRFLVLEKASTVKRKGIRTDEINKASICFSLMDKTGALNKVLNIFTKYEVNLCMIQSLPIPGKPWEYMFYMDVTVRDYFLFQLAIKAMKAQTKTLKILGEYRTNSIPIQLN